MRFFALLTLLGLALQSICGRQYLVKLQPVTEGGVYQMRVADIVTLELATFEKTKKGDVAVQVEIDKTFWNFDKRLLERIHSDNYSLQLKAVRAGTAALEVTTFIQNSQDIKKLTILITE